MSKSPNLFLPALGVTALVLGVAYGVSSRNHGAEEAKAAMLAAERAEARAEAVADRASDLAKDLERRSTSAQSQGEPLPESVNLALGRPAHAEEVAAWNTDIRPDGQGLPDGRGDVFTGEEVFAENCASCHGDFGEAVGRWPILAGGQDTLDSENPVKTIGSYWPYLSTVYDYVNRAMPFGHAHSLEPDQVYAITAYLLYLNDMVDEDFELSHENFTDIKMPNEPNFYPDDRLTLEHVPFSVDPCMQDCKDIVEITGRARVVDVTPEETAERAAAKAAAAGSDVKAEPAGDTVDPILVAAGEKTFRRCKACHQIGEGAGKATPQHHEHEDQPYVIGLPDRPDRMVDQPANRCTILGIAGGQVPHPRSEVGATEH